jgi:hypothetical protein
MEYENLPNISLKSLIGSTRKPKEGEPVLLMVICGVVTGIKSKMTDIGSATKYVGSFLARSGTPVGKEPKIRYAKSEALVLPTAAEALFEGVDFSAPVEVALSISLVNNGGVAGYDVKALGPVAVADLAGAVAKRFAPELLTGDVKAEAPKAAPAPAQAKKK